MQLKTFDDLMNHICTKLSDKSLHYQVFNHLSDIVSHVVTQASRSAKGYCTRFDVPSDKIMKVFEMLDITPDDVRRVLQKEWQYPTGVRMIDYSVYHILMLIVAYDILCNENSQTKKKFAKNAFFLVLAYLWNGRLRTYIQYCDPEIMNYVVHKLLTRRSLIAKYPSGPLALIQQHFVPTLLEKYWDEIKRNPATKLKYLFQQAWVRIRQRFVNQPLSDLKTGKRVYANGLAPLYYKAHSEGNRIKIGDTDDYTIDVDSNPDIDDLANKVIINFPNYPDSLLANIQKLTKVKIVKDIAVALHDANNYNIIRKLIESLIRNTNASNDRTVFCQKTYLVNTLKLLSRSRTSNATVLQKEWDKYIGQLLKDIVDVSKLPTNMMASLRMAVFLLLLHNIRQVVCK